jgi:hypothetical protein
LKDDEKILRSFIKMELFPLTENLAYTTSPLTQQHGPNLPDLVKTKKEGRELPQSKPSLPVLLLQKCTRACREAAQTLSNSELSAGERIRRACTDDGRLPYLLLVMATTFLVLTSLFIFMRI